MRKYGMLTPEQTEILKHIIKMETGKKIAAMFEYLNEKIDYLENDNDALRLGRESMGPFAGVGRSGR